MLKDWGYKLFSNFTWCFKGVNLLWQLLAIVLTYFLVMSGFDWWYFQSTRSALFLYLGFPAALLGFLVPVIVPLGLSLWGRARKSISLRTVGAALGQAAIMGWLLSSFYKFFTGRIQPELVTHLVTNDISRNFNFGFFRNGIFWGWPSSHTTVAFAMTAALITLYPRKRAWVILAAAYALYIGLGVSVTIHWFSDFAAGAIFGTIVGIVVGRRYRERDHLFTAA